MRFSVIIPTRNRSALLAQALGSLAQQTLCDTAFEVVVVDNGSVDQTADIVQRFESRLNNLRYVYEPEPGLHSARHRGLREARGDILVYTDDDTEATPSWLRSVQEAFSDPDVVMVGGNNLPLFVEEPPDWLRRLWKRPAAVAGHVLPTLSLLDLPGEIRAISPYYVWGCNFSVRKSVLVSSGGFHPDGMPSDLIRFRGDGETHVSRFVESYGGRCVFHPSASVYHKVTPERMTVDYFRKRGFEQGVSDSYTTLRRRHLSAPSGRVRINESLISRTVRLTYRKIWDAVKVTTDMGAALQALAAGHRDGYAFHQQAFARDPDLRAWVLKPTYLERPS